MDGPPSSGWKNCSSLKSSVLSNRHRAFYIRPTILRKVITMSCGKLAICCTVITSCLFLFPASGNAQPLEKELYSLDLDQVRRFGMSQESRAFYWVDRIHDLARRCPDNEAAQLIVDEISALRRELADAPPGKENDAAFERYKSAISSNQMIMRIFDSVEIDQMTFQVSELIKKKLKVETTRLARDSTSARTPFESELLGVYLKFSDDQNSKIKEAIASTTAQLNDCVELEELEALSLQRWESILKVLNDEQRSNAKRLVGTPFQWFRIPSGNPLLDAANLLKSGPSVDGLKSFKLLKRGVNVESLSLAELEREGVVLLPGVTYYMLYNRFVWDSISLSEEQREDILNSVRKTLKNSIRVSPHGDEMYMHQLLTGSSTFPKLLSDVFEDEQVRKFCQIEFQVLAGREFRSTAGLANPLAASSLELKPKQLRAIEKIGFDFDRTSAPLIERLNLSRKEIASKLEQKLRSVLSNDQLGLYLKLIGEEAKGQ